jgi:hypothetical protein
MVHPVTAGTARPSGDLEALVDTVSALRADVAELRDMLVKVSRVADIFYHAGWSDATGGRGRPASPKPSPASPRPAWLSVVDGARKA